VEALLSLGPHKFILRTIGARVRYDVVPTPEGVLMVCHCIAVHPETPEKYIAVEQSFILRSGEEEQLGASYP
jgi:hypothetical protein